MTFVGVVLEPAFGKPWELLELVTKVDPLLAKFFMVKDWSINSRSLCVIC
ncbi:MAG: hypothetical protein LBV59_23185 [Sphingobacterium sp.]|nr:hypothetical protein [Sphingobacterium sp.]MDR3010850.1 hypothetical protein [Sphingobacterium sp.]